MANNAWIEHVKRWSKTRNISYGCAISNAECKAAYKNRSTAAGKKEVHKELLEKYPAYAEHKKMKKSTHKERVEMLKSRLNKSIAMRQLGEVQSMVSEDRRAKAVKVEHAGRVSVMKSRKLSPMKSPTPQRGGFSLTDFE